MNQEQKNWSNQLGKSSESSDGVELRSCMQCGMLFEKTWTGRPKLFCSEKCRRKWHENHPRFYEHECQYCGIQYKSRAHLAKYCSHKCYIRDRFWRQEDTEEIMKMLQSGEKVDVIPKWIKEKTKNDSIIKLKLINVLLLC